jgi:hypothetical protein
VRERAVLKTRTRENEPHRKDENEPQGPKWIKHKWMLFVNIKSHFYYLSALLTIIPTFLRITVNLSIF